MKAIVQNAYGSTNVLQYQEVEEPHFKENEILVRVHAAALNAGDIFSMRGNPWLARLSVGFPKPNNYILGWDMAGRVEGVGRQVIKFIPGDEVFASCHHTLTEYVSLPAEKAEFKPTNLNFEQAAAVPTAATTALQGLRDAGAIKAGQQVLINGASGGVGTFAVQIAKALGAYVTGVCSTRNVELLYSLGADRVIDYTKDDFTQSGLRYDLILDNVASRSFSEILRVLTPQGVIVPNSGHGGMKYVLKALVLSMFKRQVARLFLSSPNDQDLRILKELIETGKIQPVIDRTYSLHQAIEAFSYMETAHTQSKVVITVIN